MGHGIQRHRRSSRPTAASGARWPGESGSSRTISPSSVTGQTARGGIAKSCSATASDRLDAPACQPRAEPGSGNTRRLEQSDDPPALSAVGLEELEHPLVCSTWLARERPGHQIGDVEVTEDRKSTRLNSSHLVISYAVFCLKKKKKQKSTTKIQT